MKRAPDVPVEVRVECRVYPSEDPDKVINAVKNVISNCTPELRNSRLVAVAKSAEALGTIYEQVRSRQAMGVLKRALLYNMISNSTWFYLNKQAAYAGTIAICGEEAESPLGPIKVTISSSKLDRIISWLVPF